MEIKEIIVPENWEVFIEDGVATFKEKKLLHPRSWGEFCENYPIRKGECAINNGAELYDAQRDATTRVHRNWCTSRQEAEAFLALMQLRQLRKAWVGDWKDMYGTACSIYVEKGQFLSIARFAVNRVLHFPTEVMAKEFLNCFRDLCETAKILL